MSIRDIIECSLMGSEEAPFRSSSPKRGLYDPTNEDVRKITKHLTNYKISNSNRVLSNPHLAVDPDELEAVYEFIRCSGQPVTMLEIRKSMSPHIGKTTCLCAVHRLMRAKRVERIHHAKKCAAEYATC